MNSFNLILRNNDKLTTIPADTDNLQITHAIALAVTLPVRIDGESLKKTLAAGVSFQDSPELRSMVKIASHLSYLQREGSITSFFLSAQSLAQLTHQIDDIDPLQLGFYYEQALRRECELLVPHAVNEKASVAELLRPFVSWRINRGQLCCRMIGAALLLALIHRMIRFDKKFLQADFSPMINGLEACSIDAVESAFNSAISHIADQENSANENT
ncbi:MAG: hypothetical protein WC721_15640 [Victivallaceae bacterium]|jgi:hypothetical protein